MRFLKTLTPFVLATAGTLTLAACDNTQEGMEEDVEEATEEMQESVEEAGDQIEEAADDVADDSGGETDYLR